MLVEHSGVPLVPPPDDWHHRLAGDVAAHDDDVRLVAAAGAEELAPDLRSVNVGDVEDLERFWLIVISLRGSFRCSGLPGLNGMSGDSCRLALVTEV
jgi:hypothetical protein